MKRGILATAVIGCALAVSACDRDPVAPAGPEAVRWSPEASLSAGNRARPERMARRFARALRNPAFRAYIKAQLDASPFREHKLEFRRFLRAHGERGLRALAAENGERDGDVAADADSGLAFEFYLPVPEHRAAWSGDENVLVATALEDRDVPVAFDTRGRRVTLSPDAPPTTPVIALVPLETDFDAPEVSGLICMDCGGGGPPAPPPPPPAGPAPGLYMTAAQFGHDYEGWLKGSPEMEVHVMGQIGSTDSIQSLQCAGEHAGGPYRYDMNGTAWTGSVLLFSQNQLDQYRAQHPNTGIQLLYLEDDDTACRIKLDGDRISRAIQTLVDIYSGWTGGRDSTVIGRGIKYYNAARAGFRLFRAIGDLIQTKDEYIGHAIEDAVVGQTYPGFNWFVKGENNITSGWVNLVMR